MADDKSGRSLEKAVARIQQLLDPGSQVTHNETIIDRLGNPRQFDVVIRGKAAGRNYLGVVECKDWADKVGTPEIEAFVMKARYVNANIVLMVSRQGFTEPALQLAKHEGVGTLSLNDASDTGFQLGVTMYAKYYRWNEMGLVIHYPVDDPPPGEMTLEGLWR